MLRSELTTPALKHLSGIGDFKRADYAVVKRHFAAASKDSRRHILNEMEDVRFSNSYRAICCEKADGQDDATKAFHDHIPLFLDFIEKALECVEIVLDDYEYRYGKTLELSEEDSDRFAVSIGRMELILDPSLEEEETEPPAEEAKTEGCDPLAKFPNEIITQILDHVSTGDLNVLSEVSHGWHESVFTLSRFLTEPFFDPDLSIADIESYLALCKKYRVQTLQNGVLNNLCHGQMIPILLRMAEQGLTTSHLELIEPSCDSNKISKNIVSLKFFFGGIHDLVVDFTPGHFTYSKLLIASLPNLKRLHLKTRFKIDDDEDDELTVHSLGETVTVGDLEELRIDAFGARDNNYFFQTFFLDGRFGCVDRLVLNDAAIIGALALALWKTNARVLQVRDVQMTAWQILQDCKSDGTTPSVLKMARVPIKDMRDRQSMESACSVLSKLPFLELADMEFDKTSLSRLIDSTEKGLRGLSIESVKDVPLPFTEILAMCPMLEKLKVGDCGEVYKDLGLALSSLSLSHLTTLTLSANVTDSEVISVFPEDSPQRPLELVVERPLRTDTIKYLRDRGYCLRVRIK